MEENLSPVIKDEKQEKLSLLERMAGKRLCEILTIMGTSKKDIKLFQFFRMLKAIIALIVGAVLTLFLHEWFYLIIGVVGAVIFYLFDYLKASGQYKNFQFARQLDFNKFIRMLIPYLRSKGVMLYAMLLKMKSRLAEGKTREALTRLLNSMNKKPNEEDPFLDFAEQASGTNRAKLIMGILFDFQQSSNDSTTINELGKMVDEDLFKDVDEIIERKLRVFDYLNLITAFVLIILIGGYGIHVIISTLQMFKLH